MSTSSQSPSSNQNPIGGTENTFGPYRLDRLVAKTATGTVFSATHNQLKRRFTLNVLHPLSDRDPSCVMNFTREMATATEINHPNVMRVTEAGTVKDLHYVAVEYNDGIDVQTIAKRDGKVAPAIACEIIRQAAVGVHCIHQNNLLHRSMNPNNLLLSKNGVVKIDGLGIAAIQGTEQIRESTDDTESEAHHYFAPEQIEGKAERRSDIYGLGCTLYRLLTGELPPAATERRSNAEEKSFINMIAPELSPDLVDMLQHMMEVDPEKRLQSPSQVVAAMCSWAGGEKLPKLVTSHAKFSAEEVAESQPSQDTTYIASPASETSQSENRTMTSPTESPISSSDNTASTVASATSDDSSKTSTKTASSGKPTQWLFPVGLAATFLGCVVGYSMFSSQINDWVAGLVKQDQASEVVLLKTSNSMKPAETVLPNSTSDKATVEEPSTPIVSSDTYHTKLQQQLRDEYGLTGGQWVLTPNEVALISNVVTYGANVSQTTTDDTDFAHLIRMNVSEAGSNPWDAGLYIPHVQGIQQGDRVLMVVWLRTSPHSAEEIGKLNVYAEDASSDEKEVYLTVNPTAEWRQFLIPFEANATAELRIGFHLAFQEQEIDYAGLTLINYGTSVPFWDAKSSTMRNQK